ncbi:NAD(P)-dependent alcohol dehydrogenase [Salinibius halmophilus]|uniref:NAD(P)-dependent alcohol dehydrogenase n=1 Tax=Salinibius halmophilus TaxID=1853216 RepID=UPI000E674A02|nr:NAD(P)-dependent alcohol dehydrogenase [Salinibius halmophilus]
MKALQHFHYGGIEQLIWKDIPKPTIKPTEVLIKLESCSLNASDVELLTGKPAYARVYGLRKPRVHCLGSDVVGTIVQVGDYVHDWHVGQRIVADNFDHFGGLAQFAAIPAKRLILLPDNVSIEQAAGLPQAGAIAQQAMAKLPPSAERVLIIGAGGGAGHIAVQLAKRHQLFVSAIDHASKLEMIEQLGGDQLIDYQQLEQADLKAPYDLILDLVASLPYSFWHRQLSPGGQYLLVGGPLKHILSTALFSPLKAKLQHKHSGLLALKQHPEGITELLNLLATGQLQVNVDEVFSFDSAINAFAKQLSGLTKGKVIVRFD